MVPAFGDGAFVRETVRSVLRQDDPHWRLTVIDDGATIIGDGSLRSWLRELGDSRTRYIPNPRRLGINRNFQRCVDEARAELVVIVGADDRLLPHFVGRVRGAAAAFPDAACIHAGAVTIGADGKPVHPMVDRVKRLAARELRGRRVVGGEELAASLLRANWMYFPSAVFRREVLQQHGFRPGYDIVLDLDLYLRIVLAGGTVALLEQPCVEYRRHAGSLSSSQAEDSSRFAEELSYFCEMAEVTDRFGWPRAARSARRHWSSRLHAIAKIPTLLAAGNRRTAGSMLRIALASTRRAAAAQRLP